MRVTVCAIAVLLPLAAAAGQWHTGESLMCQDCHLQHSSEQGEPVAGGPYSVLLLKSSINELCLSCHDGSNPTAPDVQSPVQMYQGTPSGESAGGWFGLLGADNRGGHNLGIPTLAPLQTSAELVDLTCAHCHAVHGNSNYRNLRFDPADRGDSIVLVDGGDVFSRFQPGDPPSAAATVAAYERDNIAYRQNSSAWCLACHDQARADNAGVPPAHFTGHPSDIALDAYFTDRHTDPAHWTAGIGDGFPPAGGASAGIPRVPFEAPAADDYVSAREAAASNEVVCISCHRPHGGPFEYGLRWPYREGGEGHLAGCQQCHNQ